MSPIHDLLPARGLPLLYFGFAHLCLIAAFAALVVRPDLAGAGFHHPQMVALVHLVTLGWISASILGAFYIVAPLALRMPLRPGPLDRAAFIAYASGLGGMIHGFWAGRYHVVAWTAVLVMAAIAVVAQRAWRGLPHAPVPFAVKLHVALAYANIVAAGLLGMALGLDRAHGWFSWSPLAAAVAHAHLAGVGWALMMVVGLGYRLLPMVLPAAMPSGRSMAWSALLLQTGVVVLAVTLAVTGGTIVGGVLIVAGLAVFLSHLRAILARRLPPPAALPRPDWATRQTQMALGWLLVATLAGMVLAVRPATGGWTPVAWLYGTAGLIGFLAQIVVGIQGRLLPLHGWYRLFEAGGHTPPVRSAHALASPALARASFLTWGLGVPLLAGGLAFGKTRLVATAAAFLCAGVVINAAQSIRIATADRGVQGS
jgi:hypothetical protein